MWEMKFKNVEDKFGTGFEENEFKGGDLGDEFKEAQLGKSAANLSKILVFNWEICIGTLYYSSTIGYQCPKISAPGTLENSFCTVVSGNVIIIYDFAHIILLSLNAIAWIIYDSLEDIRETMFQKQLSMEYITATLHRR
ncbi:hypothetical protein Fot_06541 [Forsythia ovata]|uniref:Uncharacterized protein n=1 Tax=Forsythia ovata TaxID=205694 RepID=A0ABD1WTA3_9LAMI